MSVVGIAMHFLAIFTVCKFAFVISCFFCEYSVFYHEIIKKYIFFYFSVTTEWQHCMWRSRESNHKRALIAGDRNSAL